MTQDEMVLALSMHGFERAWIRGSRMNVPFVGSVRTTLVEFIKTMDDGSKNAIHFHFPMEGETYCNRSLKFLHRKALKDMERRDLMLPPEVLNVLRHCS
jgi:hypothetical protein